ncbi:MAG TPA: ATP-binding protein [Acidobacteriaceae bacterium]|nr:ATP-binding protein [Acidobacteriaceae bacterium]
MNSHRVVEVFRWSTAAVVLTGIVAVYHLWLHVNPTTVALTLLLLVLFLAARWGLRYAVATSVAATVGYNFYFLPPIGTFTISDPQNWLGIFVFLTVAVVGSRLSERAREEAADARRRQRELEVLYGLSRQLLQAENVAGLLNAISPAIMLVTRAEAIVLYLLDGDRRYMAGDGAEIQMDDIGLRQLAQTLPSAEMVGLQARIPLRVGVRPRGLLVIDGLSVGVRLSTETLEAIGGLISVSIDRAQALEDVTRGEAAKESERLRSLMIDSITHELRTPLTAIKAAASTLLLPKVLDPEEQRELLTVIDEESDRLNQLVSEAVEMAQLDTREVHMTFAPTAVGALVEQALANCSSLLDSREVKVDLPPLPLVMADADFITKVLTNLIENAAKYSAAGSPISISAERKDGVVSVSVADRGIGIDLSEQTLIFERFYRASVPSQQTWGTGMGLAISRAIIDAHHGTLSVTSQLGEGSVFSFTLPVVE